MRPTATFIAWPLGSICPACARNSPGSAAAPLRAPANPIQVARTAADRAPDPPGLRATYRPGTRHAGVALARFRQLPAFSWPGTSGGDGGIRTLTGGGLSALPLPVGLRPPGRHIGACQECCAAQTLGDLTGFGKCDIVARLAVAGEDAGVVDETVGELIGVAHPAQRHDGLADARQPALLLRVRLQQRTEEPAVRPQHGWKVPERMRVQDGEQCAKRCRVAERACSTCGQGPRPALA